MNNSELISVGVVVSKDTLELALGGKGKTQNFSNDAAGIQSLLAIIKAAQSESGVVGAIVIEAADGFEREVAVALYSATLPVMVINPRQAPARCAASYVASFGHASQTAIN